MAEIDWKSIRSEEDVNHLTYWEALAAFANSESALFRAIFEESIPQPWLNVVRESVSQKKFKTWAIWFLAEAIHKYIKTSGV